MIFHLDPISCSVLNFSIINGFDTVERTKRRSDSSSKRSFSGITPDITWSDMLWVDFMLPSAILRQRYWILSSRIRCDLAAQWKHMQPYSKTDSIVVLYRVNIMNNKWIVWLPVWLKWPGPDWRGEKMGKTLLHRRVGRIRLKKVLRSHTLCTGDRKWSLKYWWALFRVLFCLLYATTPAAWMFFCFTM